MLETPILTLINGTLRRSTRLLDRSTTMRNSRRRILTDSPKTNSNVALLCLTSNRSPGRLCDIDDILVYGLFRFLSDDERVSCHKPNRFWRRDEASITKDEESDSASVHDVPSKGQTYRGYFAMPPDWYWSSQCIF